MERTSSAAGLKEWALLAEFRAEMSRRGWSRARMAEASGLSEASVGRYFIRAERSPDAADLFAAALALDLPLSTLIQRAEVAAKTLTQADIDAWNEARGAQRRPASLAEDAIGGMSPGAGEAVRRVSKRIRPPEPPEQENGSEVG